MRRRNLPAPRIGRTRGPQRPDVANV